MTTGFTRGFVVCRYWDDNGMPWRLQVDADYAADGDRGWEPVTTSALFPLPRGWAPRAVMGMAEDGRLAFARIGRTDAPLWTGAVTRFWFTGNDGNVYWAEVLMHQEEVRRH